MNSPLRGILFVALLMAGVAAMAATPEQVAGTYELQIEGLKEELERQVSDNMAAMTERMQGMPDEVRQKFAEKALEQADRVAKNFRMKVQLKADGTYEAAMTSILDGKPTSANGLWAVQGEVLKFVPLDENGKEQTGASGVFAGDHITITLGDGRMPMRFRLARLP